MEVAIEAGRETWDIFGELAAHRAASLDEVTRRCFSWRNVMSEILCESATQLDVLPETLSEALNILQLSLEFSLLRMCECFETERQRTDEELTRREEELVFMATHDALKIDRSFIAGLRSNQEGETLIRTLVQLGKALSIETFAEGIEQQQELSLLRDEDCDSGQGFPFARPLDVAATERFLQKWADKVSPVSAGQSGWTPNRCLGIPVDPVFLV